ncbi:hypothetical protein MPSEU_000399000 [Mayamaea pseudoterrestris]|nr:hypothetical protein MPSEU_000399000 [Mayamaea pseudoterrestris]
MPKIKYKPQILANEAPSLGCEVLTVYGRGKVVALDQVDLPSAAWRVVVRLVSWQLAPRVVTMDDLLNEDFNSSNQQQHQSFVTLNLYFLEQVSLRVVRPPLEAKEYPTMSERALRVQERKIFAMELVQRNKEVRKEMQKLKQMDTLTEVSVAGSMTKKPDSLADSNSMSIQQENVTLHYTLALEALDEAMQLIKTLLYDQSKVVSKNESHQQPVNVSRALLILTCIQCCNHASACALRLSQWQVAVSHAMQALTLLQRMKESSSKTKLSARNTKATAAGDLKLFGIVRVQSLKRVARAMVALRQKQTAVQLLESALETCLEYEGRQIKKQWYSWHDMEKLSRQRNIVRRMLQKLVPPPRVSKTKKNVNVPVVNVIVDDDQLRRNSSSSSKSNVRGLSLMSGKVRDVNASAARQALRNGQIAPDLVAADDDDDDDDSILSMSSMSASHDDVGAPVAVLQAKIAATNAPLTPVTKTNAAPAVVTPESIKSGRDMNDDEFLVEAATRTQASIVMQSLARGYLARDFANLKLQQKQEEENKRRNEAASMIQPLARGNCVRRHFRAAIHEKRLKEASTTTQKVARGYLARRDYQKLIHDQQQTLIRQADATLKIQSIARRFLAQNRYDERLPKHHQLETVRQSVASVTIQAIVRMYFAQRACQMMQMEREKELARRIYASIVIQSQIRKKFAHDKFQTLRRELLRNQAAQRLQAVSRGLFARGLYRKRLEENRMGAAATVIQACARGTMHRNRYRKIVEDGKRLKALQHDASSRIQIAIRRHQALVAYQQILADSRKREASRQLAASTNIQALSRGFLSRKSYSEVREARRQKDAALLLQRVVRRRLALSIFKKLVSEKRRIKDLQLNHAATVIQCASRTSVAKYKFKKCLGCVILIQSLGRRMMCQTRYGEMKLADSTLKTTILAVTKIQKVARGRHARNNYICLIFSLVKIQSAARSFAHSRHFQLQLEAVKKIQSCLRCTLARHEMTRRKESLIKIQSAVRIAVLQRQRVKKEGAAITLQTFMRCHLALHELTRRRDSVARLQRMMRTAAQRQQHQKQVKAAKKLQTSLRCTLALRELTRRRESVVKIQSIFRSSAQQQHFKQQIKATKRLQTSLRCTLALRELTRRKCSIIKLQSMARATPQRKEYARQRDAATRLQTTLRCVLAVKALQVRKTSIAKIQSNMKAALQRKSYMHQRGAARKVQAYARMIHAQKEVKVRKEQIQSKLAAAVIQKSWRGKIIRRELAETKATEVPHLRITNFASPDNSSVSPAPSVRRYTDFWKDKEAKAGFKAISVTDWQRSPAALVAKEVKFANVSCPSVYTGEMHVTTRGRSTPSSAVSSPPGNGEADWTKAIDNSQPGNSFANLRAMHENWSGSVSGGGSFATLSRPPLANAPNQLKNVRNSVESTNGDGSSHVDSHGVLVFEPEILEKADVNVDCTGTDDEPLLHNAEPDAAEIDDPNQFMESLHGVDLLPVNDSYLNGSDREKINNSADAPNLVTHSAPLLPAKEPAMAVQMLMPPDNFDEGGVGNKVSPVCAPDDSWRDKLQARVNKLSSSSSVTSATSKSSKYADDSWRDKMEVHVASGDVSLASNASRASRLAHHAITHSDDTWRDNLRVYSASANVSVASMGSSNSHQGHATSASQSTIQTNQGATSSSNPRWINKKSLKKAAIAGMGVANKIIAPKP